MKILQTLHLLYLAALCGKYYFAPETAYSSGSHGLAVHHTITAITGQTQYHLVAADLLPSLAQGVLASSTVTRDVIACARQCDGVCFFIHPLYHTYFLPVQNELCAAIVYVRASTTCHLIDAWLERVEGGVTTDTGAAGAKWYDNLQNGGLPAGLLVLSMSHVQLYAPVNASTTRALSTSTGMASCVVRIGIRLYVVDDDSVSSSYSLLTICAAGQLTITNLMSNTSVQGAPLVPVRTQFGCAPVAGGAALLLCGGQVAGNAAGLNTCTKYNISANVWTTVAGTMMLGMHAFQMCPVPNLGKVYTFGGGTTGAIAPSYVYTEATSTWAANVVSRLGLYST